MKILKSVSVAALLLFMVSCGGKTSQASYDVIPAPAEVTVEATASPFVITSSTPVVYTPGDSVMERQARFLAEYVQEQSGIELKLQPGEPVKGAVVLSADLVSDNSEAYELDVTADGVSINGASPAGVFYGIQTLRKSIPVEDVAKIELPAVKISDAPRFGYRGAHFDVARHFFPADSVKEFIDMLALHNINRMHWHLTDDQGWRVEIKSRPGLTEATMKVPNEPGSMQMPVPGFYTQDELRDVVAYAAERHIEIVPEIDLPGHMLAALAAYPELGCTGGPYEVWGSAGVMTDVLCVGNEETYRFLDDVFGELVEIFPSALFHIGGDECPRDRWKECAKCQAMATQLGFKNDSHGTREAKLQNHMMHHVAKYLEERGRRVIGWDEVLDSDFAENAVVMSWRGEQGGIEGARRGHDVIMTPSTHLYFDFYQSPDQSSEPKAIGGYTPVEKVYNYEPVPAVLTPDEQKHILGVQANLWTEYIPSFKQVQYMELPRIAALSEIQWTDPSKKNLEGFVGRLPRMLDIYTDHGWRYADHVFNVHGTVTPDKEARALKVELSTYDDAPVHYTLDGTEPTRESALYTEPLVINEPITLRAAAERGEGMGRIYEGGVQFSKSTFRPVTLSAAPHPRYTFGGAEQLVDGCLGSHGYTDELWLGFTVPEFDLTIDFEEPDTISAVDVRTNVSTGSWIFEARKIEVATSLDGKTFTNVASLELPAMTEDAAYVKEHRLSFDPTEARYVRVTVDSETSMPEWHAGSGRQAFVFVDEVSVY